LMQTLFLLYLLPVKQSYDRKDLNIELNSFYFF
jgi:hypothetical protein